jgi:MoaA/NifB/PqqE/SkfB family radical SAM enzyme
VRSITLTGIHFLLTYSCNYECDHCFLYCGPNSKGTFTLDQIEKVLDEAEKLKTVEWIYFEGGEPFLYFPLMIAGIKAAKELGFKIGIVTNSYWATCFRDAQLWLKPISEIGIDDFSVSDDIFHYEDQKSSLSKIADSSARDLNLPSSFIKIEEPSVQKENTESLEKGKPIIGGTTKFRGRAVTKLTEGLPKTTWINFTECPYEDLEGLGRIHVDPFGNAQICQGLSLGNFWETPLSELITQYDAKKHPVCRPLLKGGPAELVREYNLKLKGDYVDECHLCYLARMALIDRFPQYLGPRQVYGLE